MKKVFYYVHFAAEKSETHDCVSRIHVRYDIYKYQIWIGSNL